MWRQPADERALAKRIAQATAADRADGTLAMPSQRPRDIARTVGQIALGTLLAVGTVHTLAVEIHVWLHLQQPLFVLLVSTDCHV